MPLAHGAAPSADLYSTLSQVSSMNGASGEMR
jgi:hypothetical protein